MINIYNADGSVLMTVPTTKDAKWERDMSTYNYISLPFNAAVKIVLPVGAYIEYTYYIDDVRTVTRKFLLLEPYEPTQINEMSWKYEPQFQHPEMILGKVPFYKTTKNSQNEDIHKTSFPFTDTMDKFAYLITSFLNDEIKLGNRGWSVILQDVTAKAITVNFNDYDVRSALTAIVKAMGDNYEWHIDYDNEIIYIGHVCINDNRTQSYITEDGTILEKNTETLCSLDYKQPKDNKPWSIETQEALENRHEEIPKKQLNKTITIFDANGDALIQVPTTKDAKWERDMSTYNHISLPFNAAVKVVLPVGAYIEYTYYIDDVRTVTRKFILLEQYEPTQSSEMSWKYEPQFQHPEMSLDKVLFYKTTKNSQNEEVRKTSFPFTDTIDKFAYLITSFLNDEIKLENCGWSVILQDVPTKPITVNFNDYDVRSALTATVKAMGDNYKWYIDYDNEIIYIVH